MKLRIEITHLTKQNRNEKETCTSHKRKPKKTDQGSKKTDQGSVGS